MHNIGAPDRKLRRNKHLRRGHLRLAHFAAQKIKQRDIAPMAGLRHQVIVTQVTQRLMGQTMQLRLAESGYRLRRQRFLQRIGAHDVAQPRTDIRQPRLPGLRQFNLQPHRQGDGAVQHRAEGQPRIVFRHQGIGRQMS